MSAHLALTQAVVDKLAEAPAIAGGRLYRGRMLAMPTEHASAVWVGLARSIGNQPFAGDGRTDWVTVVAIDIAVRAAVGQDSMAAIDALLADIYARLIGLAPPADPTAALGDPRIDWAIDEADQTLSGATLSLQINHRTASGSLAAAL